MILLYLAHNSKSTTTPKGVTIIITAAKATFVPITSKPKDNEILSLRELLTPILLIILNNTADGDHILWGILSYGTSYKAQQN